MFGQDTTQVTFTEYAIALSSLTYGSTEDKLSWTFKVSLKDEKKKRRKDFNFSIDEVEKKEEKFFFFFFTHCSL